MFVIDGSWSIGEENFSLIKEWIKKFTEGFDLSQTTQVGVVSIKYAMYKRKTDINEKCAASFK